MFVLYVLFFALINGLQTASVKTRQVNAVKGQFMVHMLHSGYFFPHTVNVRWSATTQGKPDLPVWLHLYPSKHKSIAYLIGTPVTPLNQITIHIMARREDTFELSDQYITFILTDDQRFNTSTRQTIDLVIRNVEPEDLFTDRRNKIQRLERTIRETFRGKNVNPYIFDISSEFKADADKVFQGYFKYKKFGSIVRVGTQKVFHANVKKLVKDLQDNRNFCNRSNAIPLNKYFVPEFDVNWCSFTLSNVTMIHSLVQLDKRLYERPQKTAVRRTMKDKNALKDFRKKEDDTAAPSYSYHLWESVLVFPFLAVLCIVLILILSLIFFGRREGQHWRDYKTPKEQLEEYLSLRESQKHLRELSVQRQILLMNANSRKSPTPVNIRTFLQPADGGGSPSNKRVPTIKLENSNHAISSGNNNNSTDEDVDSAPLLRTSVARQTVADAVRATGSSLHLYKNPIDDSADDATNDDDE